MNDIIELINLKEDDIEHCELISLPNCNQKLIDLKLKRKHIYCPSCNQDNLYIDSYRTRIIKHPILKGINCKIKYACRRYKCKICGHTFYENNPFVEQGISYSKFTKLHILELLKEPKNTFKYIAQDSDLSITTIINIFDNLGRIKRLTFPNIVCIDEYHDPSTGSGKYNCIFIDFCTHEVIDILPDLSKHYLMQYFRKIPKTELKNIKIVSIDMWEPYKDVINVFCPHALVSVDSFHVVRHIIDAIDKIRLRIMRRYKRKDDEYYLLKKFHYLLKKNYDDLKYFEPSMNRRLKIYLNFQSTLNLILKVDDEIRKAYELKELYHRFNSTSTFDDASSWLGEIIYQFKQSLIPEFIEVARTLSNWKKEIINSFIYVDENKRISNGPIESINSKIKLIIRNGNGYVNFNRERNRIMYCLNKTHIFI